MIASISTLISRSPYFQAKAVVKRRQRIVIESDEDEEIQQPTSPKRIKLPESRAEEYYHFILIYSIFTIMLLGQ